VVAVDDVIRVLVVDDDAMVRAGVGMILAGAPDIDVVAEGTDGGEVPALVAEHRPDLVLMDIRMQEVDGLTATEELLARADPPAVLVMTTFDADEHVLRALRAGAGGFVLKDTPPAELVDAIRRVVGGEATLSPSVTRQLIDHVAGGAGAPDRRREALTMLDRLTEREREVALAVGQGKANAEIGNELHMSTATVKAHVSRLLDKLEVSNRVGIALLAHDAGVV
jgi:DNA-binding NarL/FixJ family response regulator